MVALNISWSGPKAKCRARVSRKLARPGSLLALLGLGAEMRQGGQPLPRPGFCRGELGFGTGKGSREAWTYAAGNLFD